MNETTSETVELTITRIFDAPRELVFRCMTEPEHLTHFWGPTGVSTPLDRITIDPRPGGAFEWVMVNDDDGSEFASRCVFVEVTPPEKLVWTETDLGVTNSSTFIDLGDGRTEVRIHQCNLPAEFTTEEAQAGFQSSLDRFAAYLATL